MKSYLQLLMGFYGLLLKLYPSAYRAEYAEELQAVFSLSVQDAAERGNLELLKTISRELTSLPKAILYEHLREKRRALVKNFGSYFHFSYGSWKEFLIALLPFFLVGGVLPLINLFGRQKLIPVPSTITNAIMVGLLGLFLLLFIVGLVRGLPRWSLPYLGFALSLFSVFVSMLIGLWIMIVFPKFYRQPSLLADIVGDGLFSIGLLLAMMLLVAVSRISARFQRFREDWTLLCFILYGALPFVLLLFFDDYTGDEPYTLLSFAVLAFGAWLYLRIPNEWNRFGVLFASLALVMLIVGIGKVMLIPVQDWPVQLDPSYWKSEVLHTFINWCWLALSMLVPTAIKLLPPIEDASGDSEVLT